MVLYCDNSGFQSYCQAVLLLCDQRTTAEQPQVCLLEGIHCKSLRLLQFVQLEEINVCNKLYKWSEWME